VALRAVVSTLDVVEKKIPFLYRTSGLTTVTLLTELSRLLARCRSQKLTQENIVRCWL